jgi:exoribonuclease-2
MERYWCLRWLNQEHVQRIGAVVLKDDVLRLEGLPYVMRLPGLPALTRGTRVELDLLGADEVDLTLQARLHQVLGAAAEQEIEEEELADIAGAAPGAPGPGPSPAPAVDA